MSYQILVIGQVVFPERWEHLPISDLRRKACAAGMENAWKAGRGALCTWVRDAEERYQDYLSMPEPVDG